MWTVATVAILAVEIALLVGFVIGRFCKRRLNETALFLGLVFLVNLGLNLVPYLYNAIELGEEMNHVLGLLGCVMSSIHMFVGEGGGGAAEFSKIVPLFSWAYLLAVLMSVMAAVSTALEAFGNAIRNSFRASKAMKQPTCDVVVGNSAAALQYAKTCNAVLLLDDSVSKDTVNELIEEGYPVLRKGFSPGLLAGRTFNGVTRYNFICFGGDKALAYIDTFIACRRAGKKHIHLYVEMEGDAAATARREIVEKSGMEACIDTFSTKELLARTFTEEHPVTRYLPGDCVEEAAVKSGTEIALFILGFGGLGGEIYRQSVLNNQLVTFEDGTYKTLPIRYYLCDTGIDATEWNVNGLYEALAQLDGAAYMPLPETPFKTQVMDGAPTSRAVLTAIKEQVKETAYTGIIIDTGDDSRNMELAARLKTQLYGEAGYHLFVRSEAAYTTDDEVTTYFGKSESVCCHDVIVNDRLSAMAKKVNEVYTARYAGEGVTAAHIQKQAAEEWEKLDYFTLYSNIYAAMNLRVKLNLLGLDYEKDGKGENLSRIGERHGHRGTYAYGDYFAPSARNALIAQEHARWNAYHLLAEYLPLEKNGITVKSSEGKVRFNVKIPAAKKHACLTTYQGLNELSAYLAEQAGNGCTAADYDYYVYDEMLITAAEELLGAFGHSVTEK